MKPDRCDICLLYYSGVIVQHMHIPAYIYAGVNAFVLGSQLLCIMVENVCQLSYIIQSLY